MKKLPKLMMIFGIMLALLACGSTTTDRALSGGAIGAGVGAAGSAATGGSAGTGAVLGGAAGAAAGALTKEDDVNLGTPIWKR
jgi:osmotically inducible lipoprotein OsmB